MKQLVLYVWATVLCLASAAAQDRWLLRADSIDRQHYYGVTSGNGMIGLVSSPEPLQLKEVVLAGLYDTYGTGRISGRISAFNLLNLRLLIGWEELSLATVSNYTQCLDMRNGTLTGSFRFKDVATVSYTYYALRHLPHSVMLDVTVKAHRKTAIVAENIVQTPAAYRDNRNCFNEVNPPHSYIPLLTTVAQTPSGKATVVASNSFLFPDKHGEEPRVIHEMRHTDSHLMQFTRHLKAGEAYTFSLVGTLLSSVHTADPYNAAERMSVYAVLQGRKALMEAHNRAWNELWKSDIVVEGDAQVQQDIHNMLYHLYASVRKDTGYSLSPMGLTGQGYTGHVFWDTEMWMYPVLLMLHPDLAKDLLDYRFHRLETAQHNALLHGYEGAMFPWESAVTGAEETPVSSLSGPYEHHITADVAWAAWQYYLVTKDIRWLREKGWPLLQQTARFWESRVSWNGEKCEIKNVVCADEWAENVDNNAFTNAAARLNLEYANRAAQVLGLPVDTTWQKIATQLVFTKMKNGVTREHDSYQGEPIKQADVNLLAYPLRMITDSLQIVRDLEYYSQRVPDVGTPAMTQAVFALLYARLGKEDSAFRWFKEAYEPYLLPPFRVMAETKGGTNPYFLTGAGGVLQAVMFGFAGLDISEEGIRRVPSVCPSHWTKLEVRSSWLSPDQTLPF